MSSSEFSKTQHLQSLYCEHQGWLFGWLNQRIGCGHHAADLTQDTFERIMQRSDLNAVKEPRPWLLTIAKRILIDKYRRSKLEQAWLEYCQNIARENPALAPSAETINASIQILQQIAIALDKLPEKARKAFLLRHVDGLSMTDIAAQLGVSRTMIKKYLVQGLATCLSVWEGEISWEK